MTDRVNSLTVVLEKDMREDDVQGLIDAILWNKYVLTVDKNVSDYQSHMAVSRAKQELTTKLFETIKEF